MTKLVLLTILSLVFNLSLLKLDSHAEHPFVGSGGCGCHKQELSDWKTSKHARAFDLLKAGKKKASKKKAGLDPYKDYTHDEKCIKCHVVGYKKEGGFKDIESTRALSGVGCEMCHGAGKAYRTIHSSKPLTFTKDEVIRKGQIYASMDQSVCKRCHGHKDTPFKPEIDKKYDIDFVEALKDERVFHGIYSLKGKHKLNNKNLKVQL